MTSPLVDRERLRRHRWRRRALPAAVATLAAAVLLAACQSGPTAPPGGADSIPGPLPAEASVAPPDMSAPAAPPFTLTLVDGTPLEVAPLWADRPLILFFFASWCGTCAEQQAELNRLAAEYGDALPIVAIAGRDTREDVIDFLRANDADQPTGVDDERLRIWTMYAVQEPPLVAVVGPGGRLLRGYPGGADPAVLDALIADLVSLD